MTQDTTVASRYARALFIVTERRGETPRALEDLQALWEIIRPGSKVGRLLATPLVPLADKRKTVLQVLEGNALKSVALFTDLLLRKKRLAELSRIVVEFEALVEKKQGIRRAQVVSAVPLTKDEHARLLSELERYTKSKVRLTAAVDPRLLGGALVRIGDRVVDRSVHTLLESITQHLYEVSV